MKTLKLALLGALALLNFACATVDTPNPKDPFESFNRSMFSLNEGIDKVAFKPLAQAYSAVVPEPVRECVGNMFSNLRVPYSAINNLLQGKVVAACEDVARFVVNTTFGMAGCFDVASAIGIPKHNEDFGQTLGYWGVPAGPYLVLPLLGPSNLRDTVAQFSPTDRDLVRQDVDIVSHRNVGLGLRIVDFRASLLRTTDALEKMDVDKYSFIRDAHIARRQNAVYDGDPPEEDSKSGDVGKENPNNNVTGQDVKSSAESLFSTFLKLFR